METRLHGIISLALIAGAIIIGLLTILKSNVLAGLLYGGLIIVGALLIVYAYCAKCPIRTSGCRHVFPGRLTVWMPSRPQTAYTLSDYAIVGIILITWIIYPHGWLLQYKGLLLLFWILLAVGLGEIIWFVCKGCGNRHCPVCTLRNRS